MVAVATVAQVLLSVATMSGVVFPAQEDSSGAEDDDVVETVENGLADIVSGDTWETVGQVALVLFVALLVHLVLRRAITRFTNRLLDPGTQETLSRLRRQAPGVVAESAVFQERATQRAKTLSHVLKSVTTAVVWTIAMVTVLGQIGVNLGPIIAGAGIAGVALGFGAQSMVKDFLTGFFILVEDQLGVGDIVDLSHAVGTVEEVSLRATRIRDINGTLWHIPNGQIDRVGNLSQDWSRALLDISVAYNTEVDVAQRVIKETADAMWRDPDWVGLIVEEPEVWGVENFGPDAIDIRLVVKTVPAEQWGVTRELRRRIWQAFDVNGIEIPFPQRTVWLRQANPIDEPQNEGEAPPVRRLR